MAWTDIIDDINNVIVANGTNAIRAVDLNPILIAICNQAANEIGDLGTLSTTAKNTIVAAINEVDGKPSGGVTIHSGTDNPNTTPPASFVQGDFYDQQNGGGSTIAFWQYNGIKWVQEIGAEASKSSPIVSTSTGYTVLDADKVIIYTGALGTDEIEIPAAGDSLERELEAVNRAGVAINFDTSYVDYSGASVTVIPANSKIKT
jgi:hypothetical protein